MSAATIDCHSYGSICKGTSLFLRNCCKLSTNSGLRRVLSYLFFYKHIFFYFYLGSSFSSINCFEIIRNREKNFCLYIYSLVLMFFWEMYIIVLIISSCTDGILIKIFGPPGFAVSITCSNRVVLLWWVWQSLLGL